MIFTEDCTGRPQKKAGDPAIIDEVTLVELDAVRRSLTTEAADPWGLRAVIGGTDRPITAWLATTGALLVLTDPELTPAGGADPESTLALVGRLWQLVATSIRQQVAAAAPAYLLDSRAASAERAKLIADLTDAHSTALESMLAVLRSPTVSAEAARQTRHRPGRERHGEPAGGLRPGPVAGRGARRRGLRPAARRPAAARAVRRPRRAVHRTAGERTRPAG